MAATPRLIVPVEHSADRQAFRRRAGVVAGRQADGVRQQRLPARDAGQRDGRSRPDRRVRSRRSWRIRSSWAGPNQILYIATDRLKLVSVADGDARDVPVDLTWTPKMPTGRVVVHAGRLVDGTQPTARTDVDIVIQGHRITSIEAHRADLHAQGTVVDATGRTVMPGLIEAHGHSHKEHGEAFGRIHLAYGITTVRSPGGHPVRGGRRSRGDRLGPPRRPAPVRHRVSARRLRVRTIRLASPAPTEAVVDMELDRARRLDYDLLKTYVRLPDLLQKRAIEGAHKIGIPVSSHEIYPAALSGVDSVEHTGRDQPPRLLAEAVEHRTSLRRRHPDHREVADDDHADRGARRFPAAGRAGAGSRQRSAHAALPAVGTRHDAHVDAAAGARRPRAGTRRCAGDQCRLRHDQGAAPGRRADHRRNGFAARAVRHQPARRARRLRRGGTDAVPGARDGHREFRRDCSPRTPTSAPCKPASSPISWSWMAIRSRTSRRRGASGRSSRMETSTRSPR